MNGVTSRISHGCDVHGREEREVTWLNVMHPVVQVPIVHLETTLEEMDSFPNGSISPFNLAVSYKVKGSVLLVAIPWYERWFLELMRSEWI